MVVDFWREMMLEQDDFRLIYSKIGKMYLVLV